MRNCHSESVESLSIGLGEALLTPAVPYSKVISGLGCLAEASRIFCSADMVGEIEMNGAGPPRRMVREGEEEAAE